MCGRPKFSFVQSAEYEYLHSDRTARKDSRRTGDWRCGAVLCSRAGHFCSVVDTVSFRGVEPIDSFGAGGQPDARSSAGDAAPSHRRICALKSASFFFQRLMQTILPSVKNLRVPPSARPATTGTTFNLYNASVSVSYLLDIFGGGRRELESLTVPSRLPEIPAGRLRISRSRPT